MTLGTTTWTAAEAGRVGERWDRLAVDRAGQADPFATYAWFSAWLASEPGAADRVAVHAVLDGGVPVAIWPLVHRAGSWQSTNAGNAARTRLVLGPGVDPAVIGALAGQVQASGAGHLRLHGLPSRDPATPLLLDALTEHGYRLDVSEGDHDNVVPLAGSESFEKTFRKLVSSSRSRARRVTPYWEVEAHTYGAGAGPLAEGLELFDVVQARSWKGPHQPDTAVRRRHFLEAADRRGWVRLLVLTIGGRPAAGNIWFRLGDVAVGWSTCYDQQLAALAPGLLLHRRVQAAMRDEAPALLDVLPGTNPFKDSFDLQPAPLLTVEAHRGVGAARVVLPAAGWARRRVGPALRTGSERLRGLRPGRAEAAAGVPASAPVRVGVPDGAEVAATPLETEAAFARWLAVVRGVGSAEAASADWGADDRWLLIGDRALVRLAATTGEVGGAVREVVPLAPGVTSHDAARAVACWLGRPVDLDPDALRDLPPLPWVPALATPVADAG